jgi:hypothetical protein
MLLQRTGVNLALDGVLYYEKCHSTNSFWLSRMELTLAKPCEHSWRDYARVTPFVFWRGIYPTNCTSPRRHKLFRKRVRWERLTTKLTYNAEQTRWHVSTLWWRPSCFVKQLIVPVKWFLFPLLYCYYFYFPFFTVTILSQNSVAVIQVPAIWFSNDLLTCCLDNKNAQ